MNKSQLFKQAHQLTKQVIKKGDSYNVTFGLCLKAIKAKNEQKKIQKKVDNFFFTSVTMIFLFSVLLALVVNSPITAIFGTITAIIFLMAYSLNYYDLFKDKIIYK